MQILGEVSMCYGIIATLAAELGQMNSSSGELQTCTRSAIPPTKKKSSSNKLGAMQYQSICVVLGPPETNVSFQVPWKSSSTMMYRRAAVHTYFKVAKMTPTSG